MKKVIFLMLALFVSAFAESELKKFKRLEMQYENEYSQIENKFMNLGENLDALDVEIALCANAVFEKHPKKFVGYVDGYPMSVVKNEEKYQKDVKAKCGKLINKSLKMEKEYEKLENDLSKSRKKLCDLRTKYQMDCW